MIKGQYHATEIQLEDRRSQLLRVFNSGKRQARSAIYCNGKLSKGFKNGKHTDTDESISYFIIHILVRRQGGREGWATNLVSQGFTAIRQVLLEILKKQATLRIHRFTLITRKVFMKRNMLVSKR